MSGILSGDFSWRTHMESLQTKVANAHAQHAQHTEQIIIIKGPHLKHTFN